MSAAFYLVVLIASVSLLLPLTTARSYDNWVVVTSINAPTPSVLKLAQTSGWRVVVVGDVSGPKRAAYMSGVPAGASLVYLDVEAQQQLGYAIVALTPVRSYTRKNIGYLYAIEHGAKLIFDTDDDNLTTFPLSRVQDLLAPPKFELVHTSRSRLVNVYAHFGQPTMWPRGFPLEEIGNFGPIAKPDRYHVVQPQAPAQAPAVAQGLANGDPDVDAVFRLTRTSRAERINVRFDEGAPAVQLGPGSFCPFNSQNTLFRREAMWGLLLPITTTFRVTDIWRGYIAQRLLWDCQLRLSFHTATVFQERNAHDYLRDYVDEQQIYSDGSRLLHFLARWHCPQQNTFVDCLQSMWTDLADEEFVGPADSQLAAAWIADLKRLNYSFPQQRTVWSTRPAHLLPARLPAPRHLPTVTLADTPFSKVLVAVVFNHGLTKMIPRWRSLWASTFPHVVFVSSGAAADHPAIIDNGDPRGYFLYDSLATVIERHPHYDGYLLVHDDMLLKPAKLLALNFSRPWLVGPGDLFDMDSPDITWPWWSSEWGKPALEKLLADADWRPFRQLLNGRTDRVGSVGQSDLIYVPQRLVDLFVPLARLYRKHSVFLELATPLIFQLFFREMDSPGIETQWDHTRGTLQSFDMCMQGNNAVCHPYKLSQPDIFSAIVNARYSEQTDFSL